MERRCEMGRSDGIEKRHCRWRNGKLPGTGGVSWAASFFSVTSLPWARAQAPKPADPPNTFDLAAIDAYVAAQVRDQGYAGLALTIMRDGKVVMAKGYGKRLLEEGAAVEPETLFGVGSVTKQFTLRLHPLAGRGRQAVDR